MRVLALGDVVGPAGLAFVTKELRKLKMREEADLVIVNGENLSLRGDMDIEGTTALFNAGADVVTGGNHSLSNYAFHTMLADNDFCLRPDNFPSGAPGKGHCIFISATGIRVLVMNLAGQVFMDPAESPFTRGDTLLKRYEGQYDFAVCDLHAEATSEKQAFFRYFDGRVSVMYGTHTHVPTADETLLPKGSGCMCDIGMCGIYDSVIGVDAESVIRRFTTGIRTRYEKATGSASISGALFDVDEKTKTVKSINRIVQRKDNQ